MTLDGKGPANIFPGDKTSDPAGLLTENCDFFEESNKSKFGLFPDRVRFNNGVRYHSSFGKSFRLQLVLGQRRTISCPGASPVQVYFVSCRGCTSDISRAFQRVIEKPPATSKDDAGDDGDTTKAATELPPPTPRKHAGMADKSAMLFTPLLPWPSSTCVSPGKCTIRVGTSRSRSEENSSRRLRRRRASSTRTWPRPWGTRSTA
jgi:hypothetical protein